MPPPVEPGDEFPEELFDRLPATVPLFTHELGSGLTGGVAVNMHARKWLRGRDYADLPAQGWLRNAKYELYEAKNPSVVEQVWQAQLYLDSPASAGRRRSWGAWRFPIFGCPPPPPPLYP